MEPKTEQASTPQTERREEPRTQKKRFHLEKLEERIAPKKYNSGASGSNAYDGSASIY
jgi:hypothetical protein